MQFTYLEIQHLKVITNHFLYLSGNACIQKEREDFEKCICSEVGVTTIALCQCDFGFLNWYSFCFCVNCNWSIGLASRSGISGKLK